MTDIHLFSDRNQNLLGLDTTVSFEAVLREVSLNPFRPDCVIITGDLIQDKQEKTYSILSQRLNSAFNVPIYWLPGNHDIDALNEGAFSGGSILSDKSFGNEHWRVILLDSRVPGTVEGRLSDSQLEFLQSELSKHPKAFALVCLHHPPISVSCRWLDGSMLQNSDQLLNIIDKNTHVRGILWGHIHQHIDMVRNNVRLLCTPSTSIQFKPKTDDFALDTQSPGFRTLVLNPDGSIDTQVFRVSNFVMNVDYKSTGY